MKHHLHIITAQILLPVLFTLLCMTEISGQSCATDPGDKSCGNGTPITNNLNINSGMTVYASTPDSFFVNLNGGTLIVCGNGTFTLTGNYNSGAVIHINSGATVNLKVAQVNPKIYNRGTLNIPNGVTINSSGSILNAGTLNVNGRLHVDAGFTNMGYANINGDLYLNGSADIILAAGSQMDILGTTTVDAGIKGCGGILHSTGIVKGGNYVTNHQGKITPEGHFIQIYGESGFDNKFTVDADGNGSSGGAVLKVGAPEQTGTGEDPALATAVDIGTHSSDFRYSDQFSTINSGNNYGQATNDIFHKFTLTKALEILITHCYSEIDDTYLYLLDSSGELITFNDYCGELLCANKSQACLKTILQPGTYYIVSEGNSANGVISVSVSGYNLPEEPVYPKQTLASRDQNYIWTRTYTSGDGNNYLDVVQYYDGLGRPIQQVQVGVTPTFKDLVSYQEYDAFGRESKSWLPAMATNNKGAFVPFSSYQTRSMGTYNGNNAVSDGAPYAYTIYKDSSLLNRELQQYGQGASWHRNGKSVNTKHIDYNFPVPCFTTTDIRNEVSITRLSSNSGNYNPEQGNQLYIVETTDEDGNKSYTATDRQGRLVYTSQMDGATLIETCYIYDSFNNLRAVLPPLAVFASGTWTESTQEFKDYAYAYKYDDRNRCIAKKLPGAEWVYYIYDNADRLIFTQDGESRKKGEWIFSIPDELGRIVLTGICKNSLNYAAYKPLGTAVVKATYNTGSTNAANSYTISGISLSNMQILTANYYDDYDFTANNTNVQYNAEQGYDTRYTTSYKGMLTGTRTGELLPNGTISTFIRTVAMYYDYRGRLIQEKSTNSMRSGYDQMYIAYNFMGQPIKRKKGYTDLAMPATEYAYTYDHAGRLTKTTHRLANETPVTLAENTYDELGRLKTNQKHSLANLKTTYGYNIRSWVTSISSPLFREELYYNTSQIEGARPCYNGNLSGTNWQFFDTPDPAGCATLGYNFYYDNLSRLTQAKFWRCGSYNQQDDRSMPAITYDKQGNITTLQRYGNITASTYGLIDDLTMSYNGNQMKKITDSGANVSLSSSMDFKDYVNADIEYEYNANGSMTKDLNKGVSDIQYNLLNLPRQVDIKSPVAEARNEYTYSATGEKLRVVQRWNPNYSTTPVIGSAVNTSSLIMNKQTDYSGDMIFENGSLKRILVDGGYIENGVYYFYVTGHLGNNYAVVNQGGEVVQKNQYYPFGMSFANDVNPGAQPYKYNGKEVDQMHGLNLYDYSARNQDPAIGRFTTMDPLAEKYYSMSPYCAFGNNPVRYIDPDGRGVMDFVLGFVHSVGSNISLGTVPTNTDQVSDAGDYNTGRDLGDAVSMLMGSFEFLEGAVAAVGGVLAAPETAGASLVVTAEGVAVASHGAAMTVKAANSLSSQEGRIKQASSSSSSSSSGKPKIEVSPENKIDRGKLNPPTKEGNAPTFKKDKSPVELHHEGQNPQGPFKEMHWKDHRGKGNDAKNHSNKNQPSQINRKEFQKAKEEYWKQEFKNN